MNQFYIVAALMTAVAAVAVALPLLEGGHARWLGLLTVSLISLSAIGLYRHLSTWSWDQASTITAKQVDAGGEPDVTTMVAALERQLSVRPNNLEAWLVLGRSRLVLGNFDASVKAFVQAQRLGNGKNVAAALGLGEALSLRAGGHINGESDRLFEEAIVLAPRDPQALLLSGLAAAQRGDTVLARRRWEKLKGMHTAPNVAAMLDARIAALDAHVGVGAKSGGAPAL